jgi:hypothetical protein
VNDDLNRNCPRKPLRIALVTVLAAGLLWWSPTVHASTTPRPFGDIRVFTTLGYPGTPGGIAVNGDTVYVDTSAANVDRLFDGYDQIYSYDTRTAEQVRRPITVSRQYPVAPMGLAGMAQDAAGRLYVADMNGRVDRVDPRTGASETYATIPTGADTSLPDMPAFVTFDKGGNLYVGDAGGSPIIWRVPPGGGSAQPWFIDPRLSSTWGATVLGVTVDPTNTYLYFATGNQPIVAIYRLPLANADPQHLQLVHRYTDVVVTPPRPEASAATLSCVLVQPLGAGGLAFGRSGDLYVALASRNQLSILQPDGEEKARFPSTADNAKLPVPLSFPFDLAFNGRGSLLVTNAGDATIGNGPAHVSPPGGPETAKNWVVYDVNVGDTAAPLMRPRIR